MAELRHYLDKNDEYVVICTDAKEVDELMEDCTLQEKVELEGDFTAWPTNRPLVQE